jgi:translation initiation factor IF-2
MAKVRVYELAREFNMDSKELVEKLKAGGLNIKNYMSTLDEEAVSKARGIVSGTVSEVIEEKRIKPTVIRRRKKTVEVVPREPLPPVEEEVSELELQPERKVIPEEEVVPEEVIEPVPQEAEEEIVRREPRPEEVLQTLQKAPEELQPEREDVSGLFEQEQIEEEPILKPVEDKKELTWEEDRGKSAAEAKEKPRKAKKKPAERPARIIKRPERVPPKEVAAKEIPKDVDLPMPPEKTKIEPVPAESMPILPKEEAEPVKKKKEKKKAEKREVVPKGTVKYRKVEVFERADLYEGRAPRRRDKKGRVREAVKETKQTEITLPRAIKRRIKVQDHVTVADLGKAMGVKAAEIIEKLMSLGVMVSMNKPVEFESASLVADEFGYELELDQIELEKIIEEPADRTEDLKSRPPVVTIMGHVDHGKTSLLDFIRDSNIIAGESGGITQHIGAYYVKRKGGDIVFLDTPGHEAFTAMRARGAKVTDIIVLVVAADDGVMPQTKEAINHARAADIPIIAAINKIDKPEANPEKARRELAELHLVPEDWGGDTIFANISARTGAGVEELLELILLQAEMLELRANPDKLARGTIIEARLDKSRGPVATVLIKSGTLNQGDQFMCGEHHGKIRAMLNNRGKRMKTAGPSMPVEIYGISGVPMAGDDFIVVQDEKKVRQFIDYYQARTKSTESVKRGIASLDDLFERIKEGEIKELNIILKTDVQGSLEAISDSLSKLSTDEVKLRIIHSSTGAITETDVMLASASDGIIIGFNVRPNPRVTEVAQQEKVDIRYYDVIYNLINDIRLAMAGLLEPVYREHVIGRADIQQVFHVPKVGAIAGCLVTGGHVERNARVRLLRDDVVIFNGKVASLKRFKEDVKEVQSGYECGIGLDNFQDIKPGDVFEVYQIEEEAAEL